MARYRRGVIGLGWMGMLYGLAERPGRRCGTGIASRIKAAPHRSWTSNAGFIITRPTPPKEGPTATPGPCGTGGQYSLGGKRRG
jgi:hypothetical protein